MAKISARGATEVARLTAKRSLADGFIETRWVLRSDGAILSAISRSVDSDGTVTRFGDGLKVVSHLAPGVPVTAAALRRVVGRRGYVIL